MGKNRLKEITKPSSKPKQIIFKMSECDVKNRNIEMMVAQWGGLLLLRFSFDFDRFGIAGYFFSNGLSVMELFI